MDNQTVWEASGRYPAPHVGEKIEMLFADLLKEILPDATLVTEKASISLQPDIVVKEKDHFFVFEVKASGETGLLPPSGYAAMKRQLERYRYRFAADQENWVLLTSYRVPPSMEQSFRDQNLYVFRFELEERVNALKERLSTFISLLRQKKAE